MPHKACLLIRLQPDVFTDDEVSGETPEDSEDEDCGEHTGHLLSLVQEEPQSENLGSSLVLLGSM